MKSNKEIRNNLLSTTGYAVEKSGHDSVHIYMTVEHAKIYGLDCKVGDTGFNDYIQPECGVVGKYIYTIADITQNKEIRDTFEIV